MELNSQGYSQPEIPKVLQVSIGTVNSDLSNKKRKKTLAISNYCYKFILDMTTNAGIASDALKYVTQKTEQLNTLQKLDNRIDATEAEETTTTNGFTERIFCNVSYSDIHIIYHFKIGDI